MGHVSNELIPPSDLIDLQRAIDAADAARTAAYRRQPIATAVLAGEAVVTDEMRAEVQAADAALLAAANAKRAHPWWDTLPRGDRNRAETALRKTARGDA